MTNSLGTVSDSTAQSFISTPRLHQDCSDLASHPHYCFTGSCYHRPASLHQVSHHSHSHRFDLTSATAIAAATTVIAGLVNRRHTTVVTHHSSHGLQTCPCFLKPPMADHLSGPAITTATNTVAVASLTITSHIHQPHHHLLHLPLKCYAFWAHLRSSGPVDLTCLVLLFCLKMEQVKLRCGLI